MPFWAHSDPQQLPPETPGSRWQLLTEHLTNVANLSRELAKRAAPENTHFQDLACRAGLLHDFGKYSDGFQKMIIGEAKERTPHAIHGACIANDQWKAPHISLAIAGHHAGLRDASDLGSSIKQYSAEALALLGRAGADLPLLAQTLAAPFSLQPVSQPQIDLFIRMLFSCLIDADRLDTASRKLIAAPLDASTLLEKLLMHVGELKRNSEVPEVQHARDNTLADCLAAAEYPERLLSLSVPTGGGKTLAAMAFALRRAALYPKRYRRIIVVIPFLSIIEQNAEVYARIFGLSALLEHHSGSPIKFVQNAKDTAHFALTEEQEEWSQNSYRPETENWDAPLIITTSVRFFESLFSNHPSDLRRVHNIARSIIILDEAQSLPSRLLAPSLAMMRELSVTWGCTFLLSTATQPAFECSSSPSDHSRRWPVGTVREVIRAPQALHRQVRRVHIDWRLSPAVEWSEVAAWLLEESQALCVVNLRQHAAQLFDELISRSPHSDNIFHLSTLMCAAHRLKVIATIRERLKSNLPCLVVSTQLIEAGVDLDFPVAFRALGPLDSIIQVAGRADREGKLTAAAGHPAGRLVVFKPVDHRTPPNAYQAATGITEILISKYGPIQPDELDRMRAYFDYHYMTTPLGSELFQLQEKLKFKSLAEEFEMINTRLQDAFVPYGDGRALIDELYETHHLTIDLRRKLQRYTVGLQPAEFFKGCGKTWTEFPPDSNIWIASDAAYHSIKGLRISLGSESLIL